MSDREDKIDIKSMTLRELMQYIEQMGEKPFRAKQLYEWMHRRQINDFGEMTNLSKAFRQRLSSECLLGNVEIVQEQISAQDDTRKYLLQLADGNTVESVWMRYRHGNSVCVSSQVGCRMGCRFCASTVGGRVRNLETSEMLDQVYQIQRRTGERVSNVIIMGIGEPLDNYDNVIRFIKMLSDKEGMNISQRNITLSTCGLVDKIYDLMEESLAITLAISLHAPSDEIRCKMMPVAEKYSLEKVVEACRIYIERTGRRVTFEYAMVEGINDTKEHAVQLAELLRGLNCHVNLIPLNAVKGRMGNRSRRESIEEFRAVLEKNHRNVTVRREMGSDIDAACGQLRNQSVI